MKFAPALTIFLMRALIIGGTRNLGPSIVQALLERGYQVAVFNRGQTADDLPAAVERLRGDRADAGQMRAVLGNRDFDLVVDTTLYTGPDAQAAVELFSGRIGRYIFLSTGQVYLVRPGVKRPFREQDYAGPVMPEPPRSNESDYSNWLYGFDKRQAEDVFSGAWGDRRFPFTSLRLPMVNSERDHYDRIYGYFLRLRDGGPLVVPEGPGFPVRHVYGADVVQAILRLAGSDVGRGKAYNIGQDESLSLDDFLVMLAQLLNRPLQIVRLSRERLEQAGLLPYCSPFSGRWMSALDNELSKAELEMRYTPFADYLRKLAEFFSRAPLRQIEGYRRRDEELKLAAGA